MDSHSEYFHSAAIITGVPIVGFLRPQNEPKPAQVFVTALLFGMMKLHISLHHLKCGHNLY